MYFSPNVTEIWAQSKKTLCTVIYKLAKNVLCLNSILVFHFGINGFDFENKIE